MADNTCLPCLPHAGAGRDELRLVWKGDEGITGKPLRTVFPARKSLVSRGEGPVSELQRPQISLYWRFESDYHGIRRVVFGWEIFKYVLQEEIDEGGQWEMKKNERAAFLYLPVALGRPDKNTSNALECGFYWN